MTQTVTPTDKLQRTSSSDLSNALLMAFFEDRLTQLMFDQTILELKRRDTHPEVLMGLVLLDQPKWQESYLNGSSSFTAGASSS